MIDIRSRQFSTPKTASLSPATQQVGFWSAVLATAFSALYVLAQLGEWAGLLGSQGGPENMSTPLGLIVLLAPSFLLGTAFLVLTVSIHQSAPDEQKVWSHSAVAFATVYAVLTGLVYFIQLTLVAPRLAGGRVEGIEFLLFIPFDSFLYAVDILGYSFMSLATLFAARVFTGGGLNRVVRLLLTANGLLLPLIALQMYFHPLIWIAALWGITFPGAMAALALWFHRTPSAP